MADAKPVGKTGKEGDDLQGSELRTIRKGLGLTIGRMAEALGMSETMVGQMERGQRPIERRTALAARYFADHTEEIDSLSEC